MILLMMLMFLIDKNHKGNIQQQAEEHCCHTWFANDCVSFPPKPSMLRNNASIAARTAKER